MSDAAVHIFLTSDGKTVRCNSEFGYGMFSASEGCNQQLSQLPDESEERWLKRRTKFINDHQHSKTGTKRKR